MTPHVDVKHPRCPYCHAAISPDDVKTPCMTCMAWHHSACADEHERCAACGDRTATPPARHSSLKRGSGRVRHTMFQSSWKSWNELCGSAARFAARGDLLRISHSQRSTEGVIVVWHGAGGQRPPPGRSQVAYRRFESNVKSWDTLFGEAAHFLSGVADRVISISHSAESATGHVIVWYWD